MEKSGIEEQVLTERPSGKLCLNRRWVWRLLAFLSAGSALLASYWFTRAPELKWWISPPVAETKHRVRVLVPDGWATEWLRGDATRGWFYCGSVFPVDRRPGFLRRLFPYQQEKAELGIVLKDIDSDDVMSVDDKPHSSKLNKVEVHTAGNYVRLGSENIYAGVYYTRADLPAFNRTYKQICDSLTIE